VRSQSTLGRPTTFIERYRPQPMTTWVEPGESWSWCVVDDAMFVLRAG
jgi:hypothetical protein